MSRNFHDSYAASEIKPPSERSTGLVFAAVAVIFAVLWRNSPTVPKAVPAITPAGPTPPMVLLRVLPVVPEPAEASASNSSPLGVKA